MTKEENILGIRLLLEEDLSISIKSFSNIVQSARKELNEQLTIEENYNLTSLIKTRVQNEANYQLDKLKSGIIVGATGVGKSKIAIDRVKELSNKRHEGEMNVLIVTPTEKLRDEGWKSEFIKWGYLEIYNHTITSICYDSLHTIKGNWDIVILDEYHNITKFNSQFFVQNTCMSIIAMSATEPKDPDKIKIIKKLGLKVAYKIDTETAIELGIVANYNITIVTVPLDKINKNIKVGTIAKPFYTTEYNNYQYLSNLCETKPNKHTFLNRARFIYNLKSKEDASRWILNQIPDNLRVLIFCGSKDRANKLCNYRFYSKPTKPKSLVKDRLYNKAKIDKYEEDLLKYSIEIEEYQGDRSLTLFKEGKINQLACVNALNEGQNIDNIDIGLIDQINSNELRFIQRVGRIIRYRVGHLGKIIIVCAEETMDKVWTKNALANMYGIDTVIISIDDLKTGKKKLKI